MYISVVIPTHNRNESLMETLRSLVNQSLHKNLFEVIVVFNTEDEFIESTYFKSMADQLNLRVMVSGKLGANRARNLGLEEVQSRLALLLDDDCRLLKKDYLQQLIQLHKQYPGATAIGGGYQITEDAAAIDVAYNIIARDWQANVNYGDLQNGRLVGGNVSYKMDKLEQLERWFDGNLIYGGTEAEFHKFMMTQGHQCLFISDLLVGHQTKLSEEALVKKAYRQALTQAEYAINLGVGQAARRRGYHGRSWLWAHNEAKDKDSLSLILFYLQLYDETYQTTFKEPTLSERKVRSKMLHWRKKFITQLVEGAPV